MLDARGTEEEGLGRVPVDDGWTGGAAEEEKSEGKDMLSWGRGWEGLMRWCLGERWE